MALTKEEIVEAVAKENGILKNRFTEIVESLIEVIKRSLESGDDVLISGFGKFSVRKKKVRNGRNPATGDSMVLAKRRVVTFKCSGNLRKKLNPGLSPATQS